MALQYGEERVRDSKQSTEKQAIRANYFVIYSAIAVAMLLYAILSACKPF